MIYQIKMTNPIMSIMKIIQMIINPSKKLYVRKKKQKQKQKNKN